MVLVDLESGRQLWEITLLVERSEIPALVKQGEPLMNAPTGPSTEVCLQDRSTDEASPQVRPRRLRIRKFEVRRLEEEGWPPAAIKLIRDNPRAIHYPDLTWLEDTPSE